MPTTGEKAPDFELKDEEGKAIKLSDYRGKKVILYFYPKDFTSGCELQACNFRDSYPKIEEKNAVVLGVSADDQATHARFREALNLPFHLLVDTDFALSKAWGCYGSKTSADGKKSEGILRSHFVIDENGKIVDAQNPVKPNESVALAISKL